MCVTSLCTRGAPDAWSRGRSTAALGAKVEHIAFVVPNEERFHALHRAFQSLAEAKRSDAWHDDGYWEQQFDPQSLGYFWNPTPEEVEAAVARWRDNPKTPLRWLFGSMIDAFRNGDYELLSCTFEAPNRGRLEFSPNGHPSGGTGCMVALLEAFGCTNITTHGA